MSSDQSLSILRLRSVLERTGLSRSTLYRKVHAGTFPRPLRISERCIGWRHCDVEAWLRNPQFYSAEGAPRDRLGPDQAPGLPHDGSAELCCGGFAKRQQIRRRAPGKA